jgi:hypothetical protein|tara:strand:+ start:305 stop:637 length:333 start_codon:yes stop_codon:yes gene_type:complete
LTDKIDIVNEYANRIDAEILFLGDKDSKHLFEPAIVGIAHRFGMDPVIAYNYDKVISILAADMGYEDAIDYFEYNVIGAWVGDGTPIFVEVFGNDWDSFPQGIGIDISGK